MTIQSVARSGPFQAGSFQEPPSHNEVSIERNPNWSSQVAFIGLGRALSSSDIGKAMVRTAPSKLVNDWSHIPILTTEDGIKCDPLVLQEISPDSKIFSFEYKGEQLSGTYYRDQWNDSNWLTVDEYISSVKHNYLPYKETSTTFSKDLPPLARFASEMREALPAVEKRPLPMLPPSIWGMVASYLVSQNILKNQPFFYPMNRVCRAFNAIRQSAQFRHEAFLGNENQVANAWIEKSIAKQTPFANDLQRRIATRVMELKYCEPDSNLSLQQLDDLTTLYPNVKHISLSGCNVTDAHIASFRKFTNLESLTLVKNPVTGSTFAELPPTLVNLRCIMGRVSEESLRPLASHTRLQSLELDWNPEFSVAELSRLSPFLKYFSFSDEKPPEAFITELIKHFIREGISLNTEWLEDIIIVRMQKSLNLDHMKYFDTPLISPQHLKELSHLFRFLEFLSLENCRLTDAHVHALQHFHHLRVLNISLNAAICGTSLEMLPPSLTTLKAASCSLTDETLRKLDKLKELHELDITSNPHVTGEFLLALADCLKVLKCKHCPINALTINRLVRKIIDNGEQLTTSPLLQDISGERVEYLDLRGCPVTLHHEQELKILFPRSSIHIARDFLQQLFVWLKPTP